MSGADQRLWLDHRLGRALRRWLYHRASSTPTTRHSAREPAPGHAGRGESGPISDDGSGGRIATATRVRLASELLGPVGIIDLANARIGVLGQLVRLTPRHGLSTACRAVRGTEPRTTSSRSTVSSIRSAPMWPPASIAAPACQQTTTESAAQFATSMLQARTLRIGLQDVQPDDHRRAGGADRRPVRAAVVAAKPSRFSLVGN